ncbi:hydrogenase maturation protease [Streptomyces sp. NPDC086023]|uniref:hydrogenase maturation protease n=1 Tax=Streptomyces sp. NPDC086023 TaxID=3365746 RepID=UPI0037D1C229
MEAFTPAAVIGVGNAFRRDDGVGPVVAGLMKDRAAQRRPPADTVFAQCDGDPGRLIELWENTALAIVVDACFPPSAQPGRTHRWDAATTGALRTAAAGRHSTHGLGFPDALRLGAVLGRAPGRLIVYAVEGADRSTGPGLTPSVLRAVPRLVRRIEADIEQYGASSDGAHARTALRDGTRRTGFAACEGSA